MKRSLLLAALPLLLCSQVPVITPRPITDAQRRKIKRIPLPPAVEVTQAGQGWSFWTLTTEGVTIWVLEVPR